MAVSQDLIKRYAQIHTRQMFFFNSNYTIFFYMMKILLQKLLKFFLRSDCFLQSSWAIFGR